MEQQDEVDADTITAKTGKRTSKKDILKAEIKLIDYPGKPQGCVPGVASGLCPRSTLRAVSQE